MILFDFVAESGRNTFQEWWKRLPKIQRAQLRQQLDMIAQADSDLVQGFLHGTGCRGVFKLRIGGKVRLRPLLCRGPLNVASELTFLLGAKERDGLWVPEDAPERAETNREVLLNDPTRRVPHVKVRTS